MSELDGSITRRVLTQYAALNPRDRQDARVYLSGDTWSELVQALAGTLLSFSSGGVPAMSARQDTLMGLPVELDDTMAPGEVRIEVESGFDRALRRAAERGQILNVMKPLSYPPVVIPPPPPTVRALLAHWIKRLRSKS